MTNFLELNFGKDFVSRFQVEDQVGKGFSGIVLRAIERSSGKRVAIKYFSKKGVDQGEFAQRFQREARILSQLRHPNILTIYDYGIDGMTPYLVEELLDGLTLANVLKKRGPLPLGITLSISSQIADALAYAHEGNIVHRDIKPGNVFLSRNCLATLIDFGLARNLLEGNRITAAGKIVGTIYYMAPEQVKGEQATKASDIYALGLVIFTMLTGRLPFSTDKSAMLREKSEGLVKSLDDPEFGVKAPRRLSELLDRMFRKNPLKRPSRMRKAADVLTSLCNDYGVPQSSWKIFD